MQRYYPGRLLSAANNNPTLVRASEATLGYLVFSNAHASSDAYLKLYDTDATPTSSMTPVHTFILPADTYNQGIALPAAGLRFANGFAFRITGALADNDTTNIGANDVVLNYGLA
jgi:hypothetical protein